MCFGVLALFAVSADAAHSIILTATAPSPDVLNINFGGSVTSTVTAASDAGGSVAFVTFSAQQVPLGITASFSPPACSITCSTTLTLSMPAANSYEIAGTHTIAVVAEGDGKRATATFLISIVGADFSVTASPSAGRLNFESSIETTVTAILIAGLREQVEFSVSGLPPGVTASFSPTRPCPVTCLPRLLTFAAGGEDFVTPGIYPVTITATGDRGSVRTATYMLTVGAPLHILTVNKVGNGFGVVTSVPAGIDCGAACTAAFNGGASVTLMATAVSDSRFVGWSGACSDTGPCMVLMDADKSVTATFEPAGCRGVKVDLSPTEVWPVIPTGGGGTGGTTQVQVTATVNEPAPPGGCTIHFRVEPVEAKGHDHGVHLGDRAGTVNPATCLISTGETTCSDQVVYTSGEISGQEKIRATIIETAQQAEAEIMVRVPEITTNMPVSLTGAWRLTGQTNEHDGNHYGVQQTINAVARMAEDYFEATGVGIGINDMSLEWGGMFDICGTFNIADTCANAPKGGHKWHRTGKSVDIDLGPQEKLLNRFAERQDGIRYEVNRIHYEFP
ncbi:MAG: hypothetical protein AB1515_01525 [Nitrospirota bacterium]